MNPARLKTLLSLSSRHRFKHYDRERILALLSPPGCSFRREAEKTLKWFFFRCPHEGYARPENPERMRPSRALCRRHTARLFAGGLPRTIANLYVPLISQVVVELRGVEGEAYSSEAVERLVPHEVRQSEGTEQGTARRAVAQYAGLV